MKKLMLVMAVVAAANSAFAQECNDLTLSKAPRAEVLRTVQAMCNVDIDFPMNIEGNVEKVTVYKRESVDSVLRRVLGADYTFDKKDNTFVVRKRTMNDPPQILGSDMSPAVPQPKPAATRRVVSGGLQPNGCGGVWGPEHGLPAGWFHIEGGNAIPATCGQEQIAAQANSMYSLPYGGTVVTNTGNYTYGQQGYSSGYRMQMPPGWSGSVVGTHGTYPIYSGGGQAYYRYGNNYGLGYIPPWLALEPCKHFGENQKCIMGKIKIDGPELPDVDMYLTRVNGKGYPGYDEAQGEGEPIALRKNLGPVSKHNSWFNKAFRTQIGWYRIDFFRKGTDLVLFSDTVEVLSIYQMDGQDTHYRVDPGRFENEVDLSIVERQAPTTLTLKDWKKQGRPR